MQVETFHYTADEGWSVPAFPAIDGAQTLLLVFAAPEFHDRPAPIAELRAAYPQAHMVGCSSAGEIHHGKVQDGSLTVMAARFDRTRLKSVRLPMAGEADADSVAAGRALAEALLAPDLRGVLVIAGGLGINGTRLIEGLNAVLPEHVVVTGGLAGDGDRFERPWVFADAGPASGYVSAVGFYGDSVEIGHGSQGGWDKFGPERVITRAEGNVLYELDGKPALELYKTYLGDRAAGLPATGLLFPLAVRTSADDAKSLVRTLLAVDEAGQSMTFAGDLPQGGRVQLMRANFERLIDGASDAALRTRDRHTGEDQVLAIAISCVGRRLVLGERTEEEVEAALDALPAGSKLAGFYSYGEISPYATGRCDLHNQTMTLTTLTER